MAIKILLVEDEVVVRRELAHLLRDKGYEVSEASDGSEAAEHVTKQRFNLIIADSLLPELEGRKLIDLARSKWPETPIIVISGDLSRSAKAALEGIVDFLPKPVDPDVLLSRVRRFLH
jgi:DNA-binding response OmpR family regulator